MNLHLNQHPGRSDHCRSSLVRWPLLAILSVAPCLAGPPVLKALDPPGGQRGQAVVLRMTGRHLTGSPQILTTLPATFTPVRSVPSPGTSQGGGPEVLSYLVELEDAAAVGLYPVRIRSPRGLSNLLLFSVGVFPEVREEESRLENHQSLNDSPAASQPLTSVPVTVNGTLSGPDQDVYRIDGRRGESLVFEVEARRAGSALDPRIRLLDAGGEEIASNDDAPGLGVDCRLDVALPADGPYFVVVHDSRFSQQSVNFYRLKIGAFSYAEALFPLGGQRGKQVEVEFLGGNQAARTRARLDLNRPPGDRFLEVAVPGPEGALPLHFVVGDLPEVTRPDSDPPVPLEPDTVVNGRILRAGEVDRYTLAVAPGEPWRIELEAATLGTSRLSGLISVFDEEGRRLASGGDDLPGAGDFSVVPRGLISSDPTVNFTVPEGVRQVLVSVSDLVDRGGPSFGYRLQAHQEPPDFTLVLQEAFVNVSPGGSTRVNVLTNRRGYKGPIRLSVSGDLEGLTVQGGDLPPEVRTVSDYVDIGVLTLTADPQARPRMAELVVWGEAESDTGQILRRRALGPGLITNVLTGTGRSAAPTIRDVQAPFTAPWLGLDLPLMVGNEPPLRVVLEAPAQVRLVQGAERKLAWHLESSETSLPRPEMIFLETPGMTEVQARFVDEQGRLQNTLIRKPTFQEGDIRLRTTVGTLPARFNLLLSVDLRIGGETVSLNSPAITVDVVRGYEIEVLSESFSLESGGRAELRGRLSRSDGFQEPVDIRVENLPQGLTCAPVQVEPERSLFEVSCDALDSSQPGEYSVELISSSVLPGYEKESVPYSIPAVQARLVVRPADRSTGPGSGSSR